MVDGDVNGLSKELPSSSNGSPKLRSSLTDAEKWAMIISQALKSICAGENTAPPFVLPA